MSDVRSICEQSFNVTGTVAITDSMVSDLKRVTSELASDAANICAKKDSFAIAVPNFRQALVRASRVSADAAISTVVELGDALLQLSAGSITVGHTREFALDAQRQFRAMHEQTREALALAADLGVEITYWRTRAESCTRDVGDCRTLAGRFVDGAEAQLACAQERITVAQNDCASAMRAYSSAANKHSRYEDARVLRYVPRHHPFPPFCVWLNCRKELPHIWHWRASRHWWPQWVHGQSRGGDAHCEGKPTRSRGKEQRCA